MFTQYKGGQLGLHKLPRAALEPDISVQKCSWLLPAVPGEDRASAYKVLCKQVLCNHPDHDYKQMKEDRQGLVEIVRKPVNDMHLAMAVANSGADVAFMSLW